MDGLNEFLAILAQAGGGSVNVYDGAFSNGIPKYNIKPDGRIYEGAFNDGNPIANIQPDGRVYEGAFCNGVPIENFGF